MSSTAQVQQSSAGAVVPILASRAAAVDVARALLPRLRTRARQVDSDRQVPSETIRDLMDAGLFGVLTPKSLGGSELGIATLVDVAVQVASACGSSGWVYGVLAGHSWLLNLFPIAAQREVFANPRALSATVFRFGGEVRAVAGGYQLTKGEGRFCSGIDHAGVTC
jgi:alkylation response protein AidB-like acyl-CoA dehydrogenase